MQDTAVLNSPAEWGERAESLPWIKGLGEEPGARARLKFRSTLQIQRVAAQKKLLFSWCFGGHWRKLEFPPGSDHGWENREEQQGFRVMVSDTVGSGSCPLKPCVRQKSHCPEPAPGACWSFPVESPALSTGGSEKYTSKLLMRVNTCSWLVREVPNKGKFQFSGTDKERHHFGLEGGPVQV